MNKKLDLQNNITTKKNILLMGAKEENGGRKLSNELFQCLPENKTP